MKLNRLTLRIAMRVRRGVAISMNRFRFMLGCSTTEVIHIVRMLVEQYMESEDLLMVFLDLEKAYDKSQGGSMKTLGVRGVLVANTRGINDMYDGATTQVKTVGGESDHFKVVMGLHQGSAKGFKGSNYTGSRQIL